MRFFLILFLLIASAATAQTPQAAPTNPLPTNSDKPVEIEADQQLEWLRGDNKFRATGNVVITQGDTKIKGDQAEASYDAAKGPSSLTHMTVTGHVVITSKDNVIKSETADYDTRTELAELRGPVVTLTSPKAVVTSQTGMDYYAKERKAVSKGPAIVTQGEDKLQADTITAWLTEKNELHHAVAVGHVIITQKTKDGLSIAQSDRGDYDAVKKNAVLTGNVKLTQGDNHMQGDKATIDMVTGYSTLQNNAGSGGRVRAIFSSDGGKSAMPGMTNAVPTIKAKENFEQPYAVGGPAR